MFNAVYGQFSWNSTFTCKHNSHIVNDTVDGCNFEVLDHFACGFLMVMLVRFMQKSTLNTKI